jgi:hypothetical protein
MYCVIMHRYPLPFPNPWLIWSTAPSKTYRILRTWINSVGFELLTTGVTVSSVFWNTAQCSQMKVNRRIGGTYFLHLQGRRISQATNQSEAGNSISALCWSLIDSLFYYEDGGSMFLRNVGWFSADYTALYSRPEFFFLIYICCQHNYWM